jgi:hypothetical protein
MWLSWLFWLCVFGFLSPEGKADESEGAGYNIRDGIIVVLKGAVIPDGSTI